MKENVQNVDKHSSSINTHLEKNVITARPLKIEKVGSADVYNMEVEDTHNFVANGIVVHNCRYILKEWRNTGRCPEI